MGSAAFEGNAARRLCEVNGGHRHRGSFTAREAYDRVYREYAPDLAESSHARAHYDLLRWERHIGDVSVSRITRS